MRTSVIPIALLAMCVLASAATCLVQQPAASQSSRSENDQSCTIAGTVLSANTGEPLKKAHVVLRRWGEDSNKHPLTATTDASGHFSIDKIPADRYNLAVDRANYLEMHYGQDQPDKPGAILSLAPGQKITDLLFRLHRTAVIAGRILDEVGDPIRGADVVAGARTVVRGKPKIEFGESTTTNDLGEYRVADLAPGRYLIIANPPQLSRMWYSYEQGDDYVSTYYPGTTDSARASTLEVKSGDEITGIDFVLASKLPIRTYQIHGHVLNSLTDDAGAQIVVMLYPRGNRDLDLIADDKQATIDRKTGTFEIKGVAPGQYVAVAISFGESRRHRATQNVEVIASDVDGVALVLTR
jgi:Carboxypeptidase regulatory-like domain